jgi:pullulanase
MGHHMVSNIVKIRDTLGALTPVRDGVDGCAIYLYGEGWDFGEVAMGARGRNATQRNMAGTGIGTFNDRLRDAVRGGGAFSGYQDQGFANGLACAPNAAEQRTPDQQRETLLRYADWIKVGLAGNLKMYQLVNQNGDTTTGEQVQYNGQPAGYTLDPHEHVVYVSAHDNETLFDVIQIKAPSSATIAERARMASLSLSLTLLSQGLPFIHAGDEILRSKSLDRNSYNSGDWFNRIDWTYASNNWGVGLPPQGENKHRWPIMRTLLADPALRPTKADILSALDRFETILKIRKSSRLFHMRTAAQVQQKLSFLNNGPSQIPGLIVMRLQSDGACPGDAFGQIAVLFNGTNTTQIFAEAALKGAGLALHPVQAASNDVVAQAATFDDATGAFSVPAYTTAVFVAALGDST